VISNKNGKGDGTGRIPDECMVMVREWAFHGAGALHLAKADEFIANFHARCQFATLHCLQLPWLTLPPIPSPDGPGRPPEDISHMACYFSYAPIPPARLAAIACPVLILQGEMDVFTSPLEAAEAWRNSLPRARGGAAIHVVAGAPHLLCYFESGVAARIAQQFVTRGELRGEAGRGGGCALVGGRERADLITCAWPCSYCVLNRHILDDK